MDILEFLGLHNDEQWELFWDNGKLIEEYKSIDCVFSLFGLFDFFFEIELCPVDGSIIGKNVFKSGPRLDKYVEYFDVEERPWDDGDWLA